MTTESPEYFTPTNQRRRWATLLAIVSIALAIPVSFIVTYRLAHPPIAVKVSRAMTAATRAELMNLHVALDAFKLDNGRYPSTNEGLADLIERPAGMSGTWKGKYVADLPTDRWGRPLLYRAPEADNPASFEIRSAGPDGEYGTGDDIVDVSKP